VVHREPGAASMGRRGSPSLSQVPGFAGCDGAGASRVSPTRVRTTRTVDRQDYRQQPRRPIMPGGCTCDDALIITGPRADE
jgi:hypothetical protein